MALLQIIYCEARREMFVVSTIKIKPNKIVIFGSCKERFDDNYFTEAIEVKSEYKALLKRPVEEN